MSVQFRFPAIPFSVASLGILTFAGMDVVMKVLATDMGAYNALLWRTGAGLLLGTALFLWKRPRWPARAVVRLHVLRGVVTSLMAFLFFWGLVYVPLAEAIALSFIAPLAGPVEIVFFQNATMLVVYACFAPLLAVVPTVQQAPGLIAAAALIVAGCLLATRQRPERVEHIEPTAL